MSIFSPRFVCRLCDLFSFILHFYNSRACLFTSSRKKKLKKLWKIYATTTSQFGFDSLDHKNSWGKSSSYIFAFPWHCLNYTICSYMWFLGLFHFTEAIRRYSYGPPSSFIGTNSLSFPAFRHFHWFYFFLGVGWFLFLNAQKNCEIQRTYSYFICIGQVLVQWNE